MHTKQFCEATSEIRMETGSCQINGFTKCSNEAADFGNIVRLYTQRNPIKNVHKTLINKRDS